MPSSTTDKTCLPLSELAYGTQQRLIDLAPLPELVSFQLTGRQAYRLGSRRAKPLYFDTLYITNNVGWAKFRVWLHRFFSVFLAPLELFSYYFDGPYNIYPYWYNCMSGEQVLSQLRPIYVEKTLLMDFRTKKEYDEIVPLIFGSYQQLILHSKFTWTHIKQLMHDGVKQLQLNERPFANLVEISDDEYDEMVPFILDRARDPEFNLVSIDYYCGAKLKDLLVPAFKNHPTHLVKDKHRSVFWMLNPYSFHVAYDWRFPLNWLRPVLWTVLISVYTMCIFMFCFYESETFLVKTFGGYYCAYVVLNNVLLYSSNIPSTCQ